MVPDISVVIEIKFFFFPLKIYLLKVYAKSLQRSLQGGKKRRVVFMLLLAYYSFFLTTMISSNSTNISLFFQNMLVFL